MVKMNGIKVSKGIKRKITGRLVHAAIPLIIIGKFGVNVRIWRAWREL